MQEFFKGWKRKVGCVTLVFVCAFTISWVRSLYRVDRFYLGATAAKEYDIALAYGQIRADLFRWEIGVQRGRFWGVHDRNYSGPSDSLKIWEPMQGKDLFWRWDGLGAHIGSGLTFGGRGSTAQCYTFIIPHWLIILPLTAISGWLLLCNPQKLTQQPTESTAAIGD